MTALTPATPTGQSNTRIGDFLAHFHLANGQTITWHSGQTGGYASYFGLDHAKHKVAIDLSDVATPVTEDLGTDLLAHRK